MTTEIVDTKAYQAYEKRMTLARGNLKDAREKMSAAWWALYEIDRDKLYQKAHGYSKTDWVRELATHEGISRGDFYRVMDMIRCFLENDVPEALIKDVLGQQMTALKVDLAEAFGKNGKLLPAIKNKIEEQHGSLAKLVAAANGLGKGEARQLVKSVIEEERIFALDDAVMYDPRQKALRLNVRWDHGKKGLIGIYTVTLKVRQVADIECKDPDYLPEKLAQWLGARLGVQV